QHCGPGSPGSDIDAIGAIGSALSLTLDSGVIFGFNQSRLSSESVAQLDEVIAKIMAYTQSTITVDGHTDDRGTDDYNMDLSQQRANAVAEYISQHLPQTQTKIKAVGYGEQRPVSTNDTEAGRQQNRRVEIIVIPKKVLTKTR
ncbi:MAG: OmpA family protein, partial [Gammaproteobacteria bacterium]|nr:OmpA family protein [Gammaproteobacteria bacterium]